MMPRHLAQTIVDPKAYADGKRIDDAFAQLRNEMPLERPLCGTQKVDFDMIELDGAIN